MKVPTEFEISYKAEKVKVKVKGEEDPLFYVHLPTGIVHLKLHTDAGGTEH